MAKKSGSKNPAIRVRMYRVGFGDCFLLSLPTPTGRRHVLIDCGVHARGNINTIADSVKDVVKECGGKLDIVVATHHHQDHISGFGTAADDFAQLEVREVWMPWTEDPSDKTAAKLRQKHFALAGALQRHLGAQGQTNDLLDNFIGPQLAMGKSKLSLASNEKSMSVLRHGFAGDPKVKYLRAGDRISRPGSIPGLAVTVLGPPTSAEFLGKMDPPSGHSYLAAAEALQDAGEMNQPFGRNWVVAQRPQPKEGAKESDDERRMREKFDATTKSFGLRADDLKKLRAAAFESPSSLAFSLDQAVNNTSLVLLFSFGGKNLLFAGDAQWGNWKAWLQEHEADAILRDTHFYKVSHHGSVNATPKDALEKMMSGELAAMVSTQSSPWPSIPRGPLMERLEVKTKKRIARSDSLEVPGAKVAKGVEPLTKPRNGFTPGALWIDYEIEV